jgi:hypothetical protein
MAGQKIDAGPFTLLRDWLADRGLSDAADTLGRSTSQPERLLVRLLLELDPESGPTFRGWTVDRPGLARLLTTADGANEASDVLDALFQTYVLNEFDGLAGCEDYALLDNQWRELITAVGQAYPQHLWALSPAQWRVVAARLLAALLTPRAAARLLEEGRAASADALALGQPWFHQLAALRVQEPYALAHAVVLTLCAPLAAQQTAAIRAEEERRRREVEAHQAWFRRRRQDNLSAALSLAAGILSLTLTTAYLGVLLGPLAVYLSIRSRQTRPGDRVSNWGLFLGVIGFVVFWIYVFDR